MIAKGKPRAGPAQLASYLLRVYTSDGPQRVEVLELQNVERFCRAAHRLRRDHSHGPHSEFTNAWPELREIFRLGLRLRAS